ncbi:hypothetical protein D8Y22_01620 [Salinadaptatus halalkaliphilus]|uniref:Uncharacterized protein n=1 Tax=Salinadaptatus halalkaliphilus TaxID=2419781 RepID=A0A4S3TTK8_9EURY|nr:hypothetical protein [Salinadaptatus halalkaliphilus]THE66845.1 hypothetical protein D8Y22_01620 [Salinadaptatus halalkaliphilus]
MASQTATVSRWSRALVVAGIVFFVAWHVAVLAGATRDGTLVLGLNGFVFSIVFGKAYGLVPSYFARELAVPYAPAVHLPLAVGGTIALFVGRLEFGPPILSAVGATLWLAGCLVFVGTLLWTIRGNPTGSETGTGATDRHRKRVDRIANAAVPLVLASLLAGATLLALRAWELEPPIGVSSGPATTHLLAAGAAALLVFAIGFRLLPRLLVVTSRSSLVAVVLVAGAVGPVLLAIDLYGGRLFRLGATLQALALVGFAVAYADMFRRSDRRRVGGWVILAAVGAGTLVAALGLSFAIGDATAATTDLHYRLAVGGFLGLTIVGVTYHFYPPAIASSRFVDDRTAALAAGALVAGLALETVGAIGNVPEVATGGVALSTVGGVLYATVIGTVLLERR